MLESDTAQPAPATGRCLRVKRIAVAALLLLVAGCGAGNPWPATPAGTVAAESHTVLLLGDSLLNQTAGMLPNALAWHGLSANVVDESYPGTGLLDPRMVATQIAKVAAHPRADIVVIEFSGNCFNCPVAYGSDEFFKQWMANLGEIVDAVESRGMQVVLVVPPPIRADLTGAAVQHDLGLRTRTPRADRRHRSRTGPRPWPIQTATTSRCCPTPISSASRRCTRCATTTASTSPSTVRAGPRTGPRWRFTRSGSPAP